MGSPQRGPLALYLNAFRLRCPACGGGPTFTSWLHMLPSCPVCGLRFDREVRGYWLGSYTINLMATEAIWVLVCGAAVVATWPEPPWTALEIGSVGLMVVVPFLIFPWTKTLYLAIDLTFRPAEEEDFTAPHEAGFHLPRRRP